MVDEKTYSKAFFKGLVIMISGLVFIALGTYVSTKIQKKINHNVANNITERGMVACPPESFSYQSLVKDTGQILKLISNRIHMYAKDGKFVDSEVVVTKSETLTSKVACGYLYIKAGAERYEDGALHSWENLYINPNMFGGHIDPNSAVVRNDGGSYSEYIYVLNKIDYRKSLSERSLLTADWSYLFNITSEVKFQIGLNTEDQRGFIDEISIAYKCWNPETGEENNGCKLQIK